MKCPKCENTSEFRIVTLRVECSSDWVSLGPDGSVLDTKDSKFGAYESSALAGDGDATCATCSFEAPICEFDDGHMPDPFGEFELRETDAQGVPKTCSAERNVLLRLVANFPALFPGEHDGEEQCVNGGDLVEWLSNEFLSFQEDQELLSYATSGSPSEAEEEASGNKDGAAEAGTEVNAASLKEEE